MRVCENDEWFWMIFVCRAFHISQTIHVKCLTQFHSIIFGTTSHLTMAVFCFRSQLIREFGCESMNLLWTLFVYGFGFGHYLNRIVLELKLDFKRVYVSEQLNTFQVVFNRCTLSPSPSELIRLCRIKIFPHLS